MAEMLGTNVVFSPKVNWSPEQIKAKADQITWWLTMSLEPGITTKGQTSLQEILPYFSIPEDLKGKRVLDIGCSDGFFSFLAEQRGADVTAIDAFPTNGFQFMHEILDSKVQFRRLGVYDVTPKNLGMFDIVFFFGVYYHLKHPTLAMERIASVTREFAIAESAVLVKHRMKKLNISEFYDEERPGNDITQYWVPTTINFLHNLRAGGFPKVEIISEFFHPQRGSRAVIRGYKTEKTSDKYLSDSIVIRVDAPQPHIKTTKETFRVAGWMVDFDYPNDEASDIEVFLDDIDAKNFLGKTKLLPRSDVSRYLKVTENCGYELICSLPEIKPGDHRVYVCAYTKSGWNYHVVTFKV